ncbi:MAG: hypothetical protein ACW99Q_03385 [Candidatus Kariarchaeaceae archaeon]|jgi:hypothetical protein
MSATKSQVYCDPCGSSYWLEFSSKTNPVENGIRRKSLVHSDHVLVIDVDTNGSVRTTQIIPIEHHPMNVLTEDIAQAFHYVNGEGVKPVVIDCCTNNQQFVKFIQNIIMKMFEQATTNRIEDKFKFTVTTFDNRTTLHSDRLHLSVGPYTKPDFKRLKNPIKGIVLDMEVAEENKLDVEATLDDYSWAAVMVPRNKKEGYFHALSSYFNEAQTPFFIDSLNNESLKELFDFIFAITLEGELDLTN